MGLPQIILIVMIVVSLAITSAKHGECIEENIWASIVSTVLLLIILWWGGFF